MLEKASFFMATTNAYSLPKSVAEIIFCGRSNVGKSSVINALCLKKNLARTSKTPGRTRSINVFSIEHGKWLIDLPGYGFARVSPQEKKLWQVMIEDCIIKRKSKKVIFIIIDSFVGPTQLDLSMANWLKENFVNFKIIANKYDKLPKDINLDDVVDKTSQIFEIAKSDIYVVSAKEKKGFENIKTDIKKFLK